MSDWVGDVWLLMEQRRLTSAAVAELAGIHRSNFTRWRNGERPSADSVIAVSRVLGMDPIQSLIVVGLISEGDVKTQRRRAGLDSFDDLALVDELRDRLAAQHWSAQQPGPEPQLDTPASSTPLADQADAVVDEIARGVGGWMGNSDKEVRH